MNMMKSRSNFSQLKGFLSYLATVKGDLSNITAPPFVLAPRSVTEIPASWAERHSLFLSPILEEDPAQRALLILKNFLCSLKRQAYTGASADSYQGAKKPLNAFLGEIFLGTFEDEATRSATQLISEQVSHHPPVTACCLYNKYYGISSSGYVAQETTFSATSGVTVKQIGHAIIRDERHGESHLMTLPNLSIKGLLTGNPYAEFEGTSYLVSSSGFLATVTFEGKKRLGFGGHNSVQAEIMNLRDGGRRLFEVSGQWSASLTVKNCLRDEVIERFDVKEIAVAELRVKPLAEQSPWESRRAWRTVIQGIKDANTKAINNAKDLIEEAQREMRVIQEQFGVEWPSIFFRRKDDDDEFRILASAIPNEEAKALSVERTCGVWDFIGVEAAESLLKRGVYHRNLEPTGQVVDRA